MYPRTLEEVEDRLKRGQIKLSDINPAKSWTEKTHTDCGQRPRKRWLYWRLKRLYRLNPAEADHKEARRELDDILKSLAEIGVVDERVIALRSTDEKKGHKL